MARLLWLPQRRQLQPWTNIKYSEINLGVLILKWFKPLNMKMNTKRNRQMWISQFSSQVTLQYHKITLLLTSYHPKYANSLFLSLSFFLKDDFTSLLQLDFYFNLKSPFLPSYQHSHSLTLKELLYFTWWSTWTSIQPWIYPVNCSYFSNCFLFWN